MAEAEVAARGGGGFATIAKSQASESLQNADDITSELLSRPTQYGPTMPTAMVSLQKGPVMSFVAWQSRSPEILGLMLGQPKKGYPDRVECHKIIASTSLSFEGLLGHKNIKRLCETSGLKPVGTIQGSESDRLLTQSRLDVLLHPTAKCAIAAFVAGRILSDSLFYLLSLVSELFGMARVRVTLLACGTSAPGKPWRTREYYHYRSYFWASIGPEAATVDENAKRAVGQLVLGG